MKHNFILPLFILGITFLAIISIGTGVNNITGHSVWGWKECTENEPCYEGYGDCDKDSECFTGYCAENVGRKYGKHPTMDVCEKKT